MTRSRRALLSAGLLAIALHGVAAAAESEADKLIAKGVELRRQGDTIKALELFEQAYALSPTAHVLVHRGFAEASLHKWAPAERHLGEALTRHDSPWLENRANREMVEKTLAGVRLHLGSIRVEGTDGADITVAGEPAGRLPLAIPLRVAEGSVRVAARAPGRRAASQDVMVAPGTEIAVRFDLQPEPSAAPGIPPTGAPAVTAAGAPGAAVAPTAAEGMSTRQKLAWGGAIAGGVALAGAVIETYVWQHNRSQFNDASRNCYEDLPMRGAAGCADLYDSAHSAQTFAIVGYALAAALGTTSAVLFLSGRPRDAAADTPIMACAPVPPSALLSCRLQF